MGANDHLRALIFSNAPGGALELFLVLDEHGRGRMNGPRDRCCRLDNGQLAHRCQAGPAMIRTIALPWLEQAGFVRIEGRGKDRIIRCPWLPTEGGRS